MTPLLLCNNSERQSHSHTHLQIHTYTPQYSQTKGFLLPCDLRCRTRLLDALYALGHRSHLKGRSSVCILRWTVSADRLGKRLPQSSQMFTFNLSIPWTFVLCLVKEMLALNTSVQPDSVQENCCAAGLWTEIIISNWLRPMQLK